MVASISNPLLTTPAQDTAMVKGAMGPRAPIKAPPELPPTTETARQGPSTSVISPTQALEASQQTLGADLRQAMEKAGIRLTGTVDLTVAEDGDISVQGSEADQAAVQSLLQADTSQPGFASRIRAQAQEATRLSSTNGGGQTSGVLSKTPGCVLWHYNSLTQQPPAASNVVFSLGPTASSLSYPGSLTESA